MFMTPEALDKFRNSSGWEAGAAAQVTMIDEGKAADIDSVLRSTPVVAFVFGQEGPDGRPFGRRLQDHRLERRPP